MHQFCYKKFQKSSKSNDVCLKNTLWHDYIPLTLIYSPWFLDIHCIQSTWGELGVKNNVAIVFGKINTCTSNQIEWDQVIIR